MLFFVQIFNMVLAGYTLKSRNVFNLFENERYFGLIRERFNLSLEELEEIFSNKEAQFQRGNLWVKQLKMRELGRVPANRFHNNVMLSFYGGIGRSVVTPIALLYAGKPIEVLYNEPEKGFFITGYEEGTCLFDVFEQLDIDSRDNVLKTIGDLLMKLSENGMYLLDFAPKDIILKGKPKKVLYPAPVKLVDTEHVKFDPRHRRTDQLLCEQRQQFLTDYLVFASNPQELSKLEKIVFP